MNKQEEKYLRQTEVAAAVGWVIAVILTAILLARL